MWSISWSSIAAYSICLFWGYLQIWMTAANAPLSFQQQLLYFYGMISDQGVSRVSGEWRWFLSRPNQCLGTETEDKDQMHEPQCRDRNLSFDLILKQIPWLMNRSGWVSWDLLIWGPHRSGQLHCVEDRPWYNNVPATSVDSVRTISHG